MKFWSALAGAMLMAVPFLSGCGSGEQPTANEATGSAAADLVISGEMAYRPRIALPPDSRALVELRSSSPPGAVVAEKVIELGERQVPIPFELTVARAALDPAQSYSLHAAIWFDGLPIWVSSELAIDPSATSAAVGTVELQQFEGDLNATRWQCGDRIVAAEFGRDVARMRIGEETFALRHVVSASGAKYEAIGDPTTFVWNKGDQSMVSVRGETYPQCTEASEQAATFRGRGNEPGWSVEIGPEQITLVTAYGQQKTTVPTPPADMDTDAVHYTAPTDEGLLQVWIRDGLCNDSMSGMPFPKNVTVEYRGETLRGCGGEPRDLLTGGAWTVVEVAGEPVVANATVTLDFSADDQVAGIAACNNYTAGYTLTGEGLSVSKAAVTMKACADELMTQEDLFLEVLGDVFRFDFADDGALLLHTPDERTIRANRR
ncbi:MAG TPA: META domain-containing protein [Steroidobacteraceae bacterium]|nr:META domain-containing protein [Steroidobacteraceae bacterium]